MAALSAGLVLMASGGATEIGLFKLVGVRAGLLLLTLAFAVYVVTRVARGVGARAGRPATAS